MSAPWFDWAYAWRITPDLLAAGVTTLWLTLLAYGLALAAGLALAVLRHAGPRWLSWPASAFVELVRSTPLLIQLMLLFYVLPDYGLTLPAATAGVLGLGLHYACYLAEVYRAGLEGVARGQWEAARALSLPRRTTWLRVVLPQALPPMVPALGNYLIAMLKDTPVLSAITVVELMLRAKNLGAHSFRYIEPITLAGLFFLAVSVALAALLRRLEARLRLF